MFRVVFNRQGGNSCTYLIRNKEDFNHFIKTLKEKHPLAYVSCWEVNHIPYYGIAEPEGLRWAFELDIEEREIELGVTLAKGVTEGDAGNNTKYVHLVTIYEGLLELFIQYKNENVIVFEDVSNLTTPLFSGVIPCPDGTVTGGAY